MKPYSVMIVDDDDLVRVGLRAVLTGLSRYEVVGEASNGRDAAKLARNLEPDIVIIDVGMAEMNGIDATKRIMSTNPHTKIIAVSMHTESRYVTQMLDAGAIGYLPKQGAIDELPFALKTIQAGQVYLSPRVAGAVLTQIRDGNTSPADILSVREREVLQSIAEGKSAAQISENLHLSVKTVESHRRNIMNKLEIYSVAELTKFALKEGLTSLD